MLRIILNRIVSIAAANAIQRMVVVATLLAMTPQASADYSGKWYFQGISRSQPGIEETRDVNGELDLTMIQSGDEFGPDIRYSIQGNIDGIAFSAVLGTQSLFYFASEGYYGLVEEGRSDSPYDGIPDTEKRLNIVRLADKNFIGFKFRYSIRSYGPPPLREESWQIKHYAGALTRKAPVSESKYIFDGRYSGLKTDLLNPRYSFCENAYSHEFLSSASNQNVVCYRKTHPTIIMGIKNPILFNQIGCYLKAEDIYEDDGIWIRQSWPHYEPGSSLRIYEVGPSMLAAVTMVWSTTIFNQWEGYGSEINLLSKIRTSKTIPVAVHDVTRLGTISSQPIDAKVFFSKPPSGEFPFGEFVASGRSTVAGNITLDEGEVDMEASYDITLEVDSTDPKWPWTHRRHYANLVPAKIQKGQLAIPVSLQTGVHEQLVRLAPLRPGAGYNLSGARALLNNWNPWQFQPLSVEEIRKRDESLARLHIALQQLADLYAKADELSVSMANAVTNSAIVWQEMVEARQKIRTTVMSNRISISRLKRRLYGKLLEHIEDNIRNWAVESVQGSLTNRQAELFGRMLDVAISARRAYFNSNDIKNRTNAANEAARPKLLSGVAIDGIAKLALQQYVELTQQVLDSAVTESTHHQWVGSTGEGIMRAVPLGAFLVEQIEQPLNDADFLSSTADGWNEIADGLGSVSIGHLFFKINAGIRIMTTMAQTSAVVRLFLVHDNLNAEKLSKVTRSAYHDIGATTDQLTLSSAQSAGPSPARQRPTRDNHPRVFTGFANALTSLEQSFPQDLTASQAEAETYLVADDSLDLDIQIQISRLRAMAAQAAEPRPGLTLAISTLTSKARALSDARMDLALAMVDGSEPSVLGSEASNAAISTAIANVRNSLNVVEQALAAASMEASGLLVPDVLVVERAWVPSERDDGTVVPGAVEIRARISNRGDAPSAAAWAAIGSAESYPGLHSIQSPSRNLPALQPGQSVEVSWNAGLGEPGVDSRGLIAGYSIRIGAGDSLISEFDGQIQGGNPPGTTDYAIDGIDDGFEGYLNRTVQTWPTRWGNYNALTNLRSSQHGDRLNLLVGGCASGNSVLLFVDSRAGGVNRITPGLVSGPDAASIDNLAIDGGIGLTFEQGFTADHVIRVAGNPEASVHIANLQAPGLITAIGSSGTSPTSGGFIAGIATKWDPITLDASRYSRSERGIEISLDLKALGLQPGASRIKLFALLVNDLSTWGSNQSLPPRGDDTDLGPTVSSVNFANETGYQMVEVDVLLGAEPVDTDADGLPDAVETGTGRFVDASNTGTDPVVADTDGDGYSDGGEVSGISLGRQSDPTVSDYSGIVVTGSFNLPQPWNPSLYGNSPDTTMTRNTRGSLPDFYRWTLDYQFLSSGWIEYKFAAGSWTSNWGSGSSPNEAKYSSLPNLRARIEATGIHRFDFDQAAGTQLFKRVNFTDLASFLRAYGLGAGSDVDQDGVLNEAEFVANTDPTRSDSDNDGTGDATDPAPLQPTRDVVFIADLWVEQSLGRFNPEDGRVFVRFANGSLKSLPDLELLPAGEFGIYRGTLPQVSGMEGEDLGSYHLVRTNGSSTTSVEESVIGSRRLVAGAANRTQSLPRTYFDNQVPPLNPAFNRGSDVPVTSVGFMATGSSLGSLSLGFAPSPMQELFLVNNTGSAAISGTFSGLAEGATLSASYGGNNFTFRISYAGGDGNDITLTRVAGVGQVTNSNTYLWTHLAGSTGGLGSADGTGPQASFNYPSGVAVDTSGNIYVADYGNHTIRKVTPAGVVTTLAGSAGLSGSTDGTGSAARFNNPNGVAVDSAGNLYVADYSNHTIRKVSPAGVVTTLAGTALSSGSTDGAGSAARFNKPEGVVVDTSGNVYVADLGNHTIRKVTQAGVVTTLAGSAGLSGSTDGAGSAARFNSPTGVAVDSAGNVYVADYYNHTIRKVTPAGVVTTLAGTALSSGSTDGIGSAARFNSPAGVAVDTSGNVYVADSLNHTIRKVTPVGVVTTLAGMALTRGSTDGTGSTARFNYPYGVAVDSTGNVYVAATYNHNIRKVTPAGVVTTLAGTALTRGSTNGTGSAARFHSPSGMAVDTSGNIYVADYFNHTIRKVSPAGVVTTLAGTALSSGSADGIGSAARFYNPNGVAVDSTGNVYVAEQLNHTIRKVSPAGVVTTLAGTALSSGSADGTGSAARFNYPSGVAVDSMGNLYVGDSYNHTIRKVSPAGVVTTLAGTALSSGSTDGTGSAARFNSPAGVAVDSAGNLYVSEQLNHTIRKVTPAGVVTTLAGTALSSGSTDGTGSAARFYNPVGMAVDSAGNIYVTDTTNHTIRKVTSAGVVTTVGGLAGKSGSILGYGSAAEFAYPRYLALSSSVRIYVADNNHRVVQGELPGFQPILTLGSVSGLGGGGATLNGTVNPNGFVTTAAFEYGTTLAYGSSASVTLSSATGTTAQNVSTGLTGLNPETLYHYRLTATNVDGTAYTTGGTFTTSTPSTNAELSSLTLSGVSLNPDFASATTSYTASMANTATSITVTPTLAQPDATISVRINGGTYAPVMSGSASGELPLAIGSNTIEVRVTAQDGVTQKTYTVTLTVSSSNSGGGAIATWRQQYFGSGENSGNAADLATPDGDGIPNLVKYTLLMTPGQNGSSRLPQAEMTGTTGNRRLALSFQRDPSRNDVSIIVEAQSALGGIWTEIARSTNGAAFAGSAAVSETAGNNGITNVSVQDVEMNASRRFMRVRVER